MKPSNSPVSLAILVVAMLLTQGWYLSAVCDSQTEQKDAKALQAPSDFPGIHLGMTLQEFIPLRKSAKAFDARGKAHTPQIENAGAFANALFDENMKGHSCIDNVKYLFTKGRLCAALFSSETSRQPALAKMEEMVFQSVARYGAPSQIEVQGDTSKEAIILWHRNNGGSFISFSNSFYQVKTRQDWNMWLADGGLLGAPLGEFRKPTIGDEKYLLGPVRLALVKAGQKLNVAIPARLLKPAAIEVDPKFSVDHRARELFEKVALNYKNLGSLTLSIKTRDLSPEPQSIGTGLTKVWFQRPDKVRSEFQGEEKRFYMMDGKFTYTGSEISNGGGYEKRPMGAMSPEDPDPAAYYVGLAGYGIGQLLEQLLQGKFFFADRAEAGQSEFLKGSKVEYLPPKEVSGKLLEGFRVRELGKGHLSLSEYVAWFDTKTGLLARTQYHDYNSASPLLLIDEVVATQLNPAIEPEVFVFRPQKGISVIEPKQFVLPKP